MDEHRLGLLPVMRRVWTQDGDQPIAQVKHQKSVVVGLCFCSPGVGRNLLVAFAICEYTTVQPLY
ncbi:MAG: hypothetical protein F6K26_55780 [Moorea sp. SIO2I5]|nr:hypothetical protein [Moorena sp. SIO2I5]